MSQLTLPVIPRKSIPSPTPTGGNVRNEKRARWVEKMLDAFFASSDEIWEVTEDYLGNPITEANVQSTAQAFRSLIWKYTTFANVYKQSRLITTRKGHLFLSKQPANYYRA